MESYGVINITESAKERISDLISSEKENTLLRVYIEGGGCSGFQYGFKFDETIYDGDQLFLNGNVIIDPMSLQYLHDSTLDYIVSLEGSRFVFKNPNAKTKCGCGSSFSI